MQRFLCLLILALAACGGARPRRAPDDNQIRDDAIELCHTDSGSGRSDFAYVASYRCPDGTTPLQGDVARAADARVGYLGASTDGHILDLYEIPCPGAAVRIYVDGYHCATTDAELDPGNLRRDELADMARRIRALHADPTSESSMELRSELFVWVLNTQQFTVLVCHGLVPLLPSSEHEVPYIAELTLALAASVIEDGRDPVDPVRANVSAIQGLLVYYDAALRARGEVARDPQLDALREMDRNGTLQDRVREAVGRCDLSNMGVHRYRE